MRYGFAVLGALELTILVFIAYMVARWSVLRSKQGRTEDGRGEDTAMCCEARDISNPEPAPPEYRILHPHFVDDVLDRCMWFRDLMRGSVLGWRQLDVIIKVRPNRSLDLLDVNIGPPHYLTVDKSPSEPTVEFLISWPIPEPMTVLGCCVVGKSGTALTPDWLDFKEGSIIADGPGNILNQTITLKVSDISQ